MISDVRRPQLYHCTRVHCKRIDMQESLYALRGSEIGSLISPDECSRSAMIDVRQSISLPKTVQLVRVRCSHHDSISHCGFVMCVMLIPLQGCDHATLHSHQVMSAYQSHRHTICTSTRAAHCMATTRVTTGHPFTCLPTSCHVTQRHTHARTHTHTHTHTHTPP